jgi:hypothetical protein
MSNVTSRSCGWFALLPAFALAACGQSQGPASTGPEDESSSTVATSAANPSTGESTTVSTTHQSSTGATGSSTTTPDTGASGSSGEATSAGGGGTSVGNETSDDDAGVSSFDTSGAGNAETTATSSGTSSTITSSSAQESTAPTECTRELLDALLDQYFVALSEGDPSALPLANNVKFTENANEGEIGATEFWQNAGEVKHSQRALDTTQCSVAAQAVVPEGAMDLPIGIRIKVEAGEMAEIETIVVRPGDYTASFAVDSDPSKIIEMAEEIGWDDEVEEADRATRDELTAWIEKYFRAFPNGVCDTTTECIRLENGGGNFACGSSCGGGSGGFEPRVIIVDEVRGITAGFTIFDFQTDGHLDMHMAKMSGGQVHAVHAILRDTDGLSGWE